MTWTRSILPLVLGACTLGAVGTTAASADAALSIRVSHRPVLVIGKPKPASRVVVVNGRRLGTVDVNARPKATKVWVDGRYRGLAGQLDGSPDKLHLVPGRHRLKLVTPDGTVLRETIHVRAGEELNVNVDLR